MKNIDKALELLKNASDLDDAFDRLQEIRVLYGFDNYIFSQTSTDNSPAVFNVKFFRYDYPEEWMKRYIEKNYFFSDPILKLMLVNTPPFFWSEATAEYPMDDNALKMFEESQKHGIVDGVGFSCLKNQGNLYTLCYSKNELFSKYDYTMLAELSLISKNFICLYERLNTTDKEEKINLTLQEKKVVTYAALGKTDPEIAQILEISVNTIRYHWKNIFDKFNCYGRVFAIIQAINLGFVDMGVLQIPTKSGSTETYHNNVC